MSHYLNSAKYKYLATDQEFIAIVMDLKFKRHFLLGKPFLCHIHHASLKWLQT